MSEVTRSRFRFTGALAVLLSTWLGCASQPLPEVVPNCKTQLAPGDTGFLSSPCPGTPGVSSPCNGSPSGVPLIDCEINDAPVGHFRTLCVETCPDVGTER